MSGLEMIRSRDFVTLHHGLSTLIISSKQPLYEEIVSEWLKESFTSFMFFLVEWDVEYKLGLVNKRCVIVE